jgi:non-heme chloroperoxidase
MPYFTTADGTNLYFTDQGKGQPVLLSHGWPLSTDARQDEVTLLAASGFRVIAHDRRGHGRSSRNYAGDDLDTYATDLAELIVHLDLRDVVLIGLSSGDEEAVREAARHAEGRVVKAVAAAVLTEAHRGH